MRTLASIALFTTLVGVSLPTVALGATGDVTRYLGRIYAGDGETAIHAQLDRPRGIAVTRDGSVYIADSENNVVRKIKGSTQIVSTLAGNGNIGANDSTATRSTFDQPADVAVWNNRVLVADSGTGRIRVINNGNVTTLRRNLKDPEGIKVYGSVLYVAETGANRILRMNPANGTITRVYPINAPTKFVKINNVLYVISGHGTAVTRLDLANGRLRGVKSRLTDAGGITNVNGRVVFSDGKNGIYNTLWQYHPGTRTITRLVNKRLETEWYNYISDLEFVNGKLYASFSRGSSIFTMTSNGNNPIRIAGEHRYGDRDGSSSQLLMGRPKDLELSPDGNTIYVLENSKLKAYDRTSQQLRLLAGHANDNYIGEGQSGIFARFSGPNQIAASPDGTRVYVADRNNNRIRYVTVADGTTGYVTGAGTKNADASTQNGYSEGGSCSNQFSHGVAGCAYFSRPNGIEISLDGSILYVADTQNHRIRTVNVATGQTAVLAGNGTAGLTDGTGTNAAFHDPWTLELSSNGTTLYVADRGNHAIRAISLSTHAVTTIAGNGHSGFRNGSASNARFSFPEYVNVGPGNTLIISESGTNRLRQINLTTHEVTTLAGNGHRGSVNGTATRATFNQPKGGVILGTKFLVTDQLNDLIRAVQL